MEKRGPAPHGRVAPGESAQPRGQPQQGQPLLAGQAAPPQPQPSKPGAAAPSDPPQSPSLESRTPLRFICLHENEASSISPSLLAAANASQNLVHLEERTLATDYAEGLEMLHAQAALRLGVDVIVMDTLLPARKPLIVERLRAHIGRNVVIAVITGADDAREVCIACVRAGADVLLRRPIAADELGGLWQHCLRVNPDFWGRSEVVAGQAMASPPVMPEAAPALPEAATAPRAPRAPAAAAAPAAARANMAQEAQKPAKEVSSNPCPQLDTFSLSDSSASTGRPLGSILPAGPGLGQPAPSSATSWTPAGRTVAPGTAQRPAASSGGLCASATCDGRSLALSAEGCSGHRHHISRPAASASAAAATASNPASSAASASRSMRDAPGPSSSSTAGSAPSGTSADRSPTDRPAVYTPSFTDKQMSLVDDDDVSVCRTQ